MYYYVEFLRACCALTKTTFVETEDRIEKLDKRSMRVSYMGTKETKKDHISEESYLCEMLSDMRNCQHIIYIKIKCVNWEYWLE